MPLSKEDPLVRTAVLGKEVEEFLHSDIGHYMTARADAEIAQATEQLKRVSPSWFWGRRKIVRLQNQIAVAERVLHWLAEAITEGRHATEILEDSK